MNDLNIIGIGFLFNAMKTNIILAPNNFCVVLKLLFHTIKSTVFITSHELMTVVLIFEHLIFRANEHFIEEHVKIYLKSASIMTKPSSSTPTLCLDSREFDDYEYFINEIFEFFKNSVNVLNTTQYENKQFLRNLKKFIIILTKLAQLSNAFCGVFRNNEKFLVESLLSKVSSLIIPFYIDAGIDYLEFLQIINDISSKPEDVKINAVKKICNNTVRVHN